MKEYIENELKHEFETIENISVFISEELINKKEIKNVMNEEIFEGESNGYFVYIDYSPEDGWIINNQPFKLEREYRFYTSATSFEKMIDFWDVEDRKLKLQKIKQS